MTRAPLEVAVVGAGIGGLTAAVALRQAGFAVTVFEQAPALTQIGGGINVGPNAARVLIGLGLGPALDASAVYPVATARRRWDDGRVLQRAPLNPDCQARYGAPYLMLHRADLLAAIAGGFPAAQVRLGHCLTGLVERGPRVELGFANGARAEADVVVGADGIHSVVRTMLFGAAQPPFAGCVAYRGLVPAERVADLGIEVGLTGWLGPGAHLVHYFVARGRLLNFVGWTEHDAWNREDWTDQATVERARGAFAGWHPEVLRIIGAADACFIWALFDRDPLARWSIGRVTLLGDACHPMYPFMAQGAAQAIEDGAALAACLVAGAEDPAAALQRYERLRLPRVSRLQAMSRANKLSFHLPDGAAQQARDAEWAAGEPTQDAMGWLWGHDAGAIAVPHASGA